MVEKEKTSRYSPEFRERAVRLLDEHRSDYPSLSAACREIGGKLGCSGDSLHDWWKQARRDAGAAGANHGRDGTDQGGRA